ncbi:cytochrome B6 [Ralstonia solanacearum]|nr:cytochrome B6 [Ralstonia solanacearum]
MKSRAIWCMDALAGLQIVCGLALLVYVLFFANITLDEVRMGKIAVAGGGAALVAILALVLQLPVLIFTLLKRRDTRWRVLASMLIGVAVFVGLFEAADSWVVRKLPYLHTIPLPTDAGQPR